MLTIIGYAIAGYFMLSTLKNIADILDLEIDIFTNRGEVEDLDTFMKLTKV